MPKNDKNKEITTFYVVISFPFYFANPVILMLSFNSFFSDDRSGFQANMHIL